ncbi:uncharacterized protein [Anser cygnoides]|uniref:uncharacterized protein isoform X2 n=1 Tax=Anser cygnoides TaxID=8845 RepID=UPI0034D2AC7C
MGSGMSKDMTYLCISASDSSSQNLMQHFKECIKFIHECRLHGGGCLVHCLAGVSRSTTVLVAYLMTVTDLGWERCLAATRAARSYASPNPGFQRQLQDYERTLLKEHGDLAEQHPTGWRNPDVPVSCGPGPPPKDKECLEGISLPSSQAGQHVTVAQASAPSWPGSGGRRHMRDVALRGCHRFAKTPAELGRVVQGIAKPPLLEIPCRASPSRASAPQPCPGHVPVPAVTRGSPCPRGLLLGTYSSCSPTFGWPQQTPLALPLPLEVTFSLGLFFFFFAFLKFCCKRFPGSTSGCARLRVREPRGLKNGICFARAAFFFKKKKNAAFPVMASSGVAKAGNYLIVQPQLGFSKGKRQDFSGVDGREGTDLSPCPGVSPGARVPPPGCLPAGTGAPGPEHGGFRVCGQRRRGWVLKASTWQHSGALPAAPCWLRPSELAAGCQISVARLLPPGTFTPVGASSPPAPRTDACPSPVHHSPGCKARRSLCGHPVAVPAVPQPRWPPAGCRASRQLQELARRRNPVRPLGHPPWEAPRFPATGF